jgi:Uma2 family endonuclease
MPEYIYDINELDLNKTYSYADYLLWKFQERIELIKGKIFKMSPAPNVFHQQISRTFGGKFYLYFESKSCEYFMAPFDVALVDQKKSSSDKTIFTILQPDLCVICDAKKIADGKKCVGAPDLIIEILSPGNSKKEMDIKFDLYEEAGVLEYWIVSPMEKTVLLYFLQDENFRGLKPFTEGQLLKSRLFPDLEIDLTTIFN